MMTPSETGRAHGRRRWLREGGIAAGGVLLIVLGVWLGRTEPARAGSGDPMAELVRITEKDAFRRSEARLSAPFPHRPPRPASGRYSRAELPQTRLAEWISELAWWEQSNRIYRSHAMGIARLVSGDARGAIRLLMRAAVRIESRGGDAAIAAGIWNDLAVARYEVGKSGDFLHLIAALDAAERASANAPNVPPVVWTRAVLLDELHLRERAAAAWRHYLALDSTSPWADEARDRLRGATQSVQSVHACEREDATVYLRRVENLDARWAGDEAWQARMRALYALRCRSAARHPVIGIDIATAAIRDGFELAADIIVQEIDAEAKRRGQTDWITKAATVRAIIRSRVKDPFTATDFNAMRRASSWVRQEAAPATQMAAAAAGSVSFRGTATSPPDLNDRPERTALPQRLSVDAMVDAPTVDASFLAAVNEIERQIVAVDDPGERALRSEQVRSLLIVSAELQLGHGRPLEALWFSDRARDVLFRTFGSAGWEASPNLDALVKKLIDELPREVTVVHQDLQSDALLTWVIRDGYVDFVRTPLSAAVLTTEIDAFVSDLRHLSHEAIVPIAQELYGKIFGPVGRRLFGTKTLVYSPAPALRRLPVGALHDGQGYVIEGRSVVVTRSVGRLVREPFAFQTVTGEVLVTLAVPGIGSPALEGARNEVASVAAIHDGRSVSLLGSEATARNFLAMAPRFDIIHVAAHGRVSARPLQNALEFGAERVTTSDVTELRLEKHPVVILAGCRTDDETSGRATLSLTNAFIAAGASAVVGTLWDIEDRSTARLMTELHRELARGLTPADALRKAQQAAIRRGDPMSTWAAFQVQM